MTAPERAKPCFAISRLTLTDFRNYDSLRLTVPAGLIALVGENGAGKTNLLEAISMLSPGRGLRGAEAASLGRHGGEGAWAVSARVETPLGETQLGTAWSPSETEGQSAQRAVLIDGHLQRSASALSERLRLLWLTPAQDRLFAGPPSERRRYLDRMVALLDSEHGTRVSGFEKLMRERNLLLTAGSSDMAWLAALEAQMAEHAVAIAAARIYATSRINTSLTAERIPSPFPWGRVSLEGEIEALVEKLPALAAEENYRHRLHEGRSADRAASRTLSGPHRSDFMVLHGPKGVPASEGSTGEQKALLIGLLLAQVDAVTEAAGGRPVVLLDEVSAHLDRARKTALFGLLEGLRVQAWMSGTEPQVFDGVSASTVVYQVDSGTLHESKF
jgi:DNA replication and repair protein RecF